MMLDNLPCRSAVGKCSPCMRPLAARIACTEFNYSHILREIIEEETHFDDRVPVWRREVQRDALPNLTDDELVRVVAG